MHLGNPALLQKAVFPEYKPETMRSFEAGYKGLINKKVLIDIYGYLVNMRTSLEEG